MRKILKVIGYVFLGLGVVVAILVVAIAVKSRAALKQTYAVSVKPVVIPTDQAAIEHGRHLAATRGCIDCHGKDFAGAKVIDDGAMGRLWGTNLTRGKGSAVAAFKDEDWVRAIRHGVGSDGRGLFIMPAEEYSHFSDADLGALVAYLKTIPPVDREPVPTKYGPVTRVLLAVSPTKMIAAGAIDHANLAPAFVPKAITPEYGRYLAAGCTGCHGSNYSGGKIEIGPPDWPLAANLTPHPDSNLARWSEQDFINTIRTARRPDGTEVNPVMPRGFGGMDDIELKALWAFFKSLPPTAQGAR